MRKVLLFLGLALLCVGMLSAQKRTIAFYNVENMFDTLPSIFYDDSDYTPEGRYRWGSDRYFKKVKDVARVLDDVRADVVGIAEIENETVVRDLVRAMTTDYCYVHITSNDAMGRDLALLYKADCFEVEEAWLSSSETSREFLNVKGELLGQKVHIIVCHLPSVFRTQEVRQKALMQLKRQTEYIARSEQVPIFVLGDMNWAYDKAKQEILGFEAPLLRLVEKGYGSYYVNDSWQLIDNIFVGGKAGFQVVDCGIYIRDYMLRRTAYRTAPYRTFTRSRYVGGISDHLPVYLIVEPEISQ